MKLLTKLYKTFSPTWREDAMSALVQERLDSMGIEYSLTALQIHNIKPYKPLLCAHMDQVGSQPVRHLSINNDMIWGDVQIGADDKNGIWICLRLLEMFPDVGFVFSTGEEAGCDIDDVLEEYDADVLDSVLYGLIFDRRGSSDIIGVGNDYCKPDLQDDITHIARPMKFFPNTGIWSDADMLAYYDIPCVNISAAYYQPHTDAEFTDLKELAKVLLLGRRILLLCDKLYDRTDYFELNKEQAIMMADFGERQGRTRPPLNPDDEEEQRDCSPRRPPLNPDDEDSYDFYCTTCDIELTDFDITKDYLCKECWGEVQSLDDYEFYSGNDGKGVFNDSLQNYSGAKSYDDELERSDDGETRHKKTEDGWTQLDYCPVCSDFVMPVDDGCPDCKATLIKSAMYNSM